jgi:hypothetical protein
MASNNKRAQTTIVVVVVSEEQGTGRLPFWLSGFLAFWLAGWLAGLFLSCVPPPRSIIYLRVVVHISSQVIKRFILHAKKTAFVVEHDFIMATYLADRVVVYDGNPGIECRANAPQGLLTGMNQFLAQLKIRYGTVRVGRVDPALVVARSSSSLSN